MIHQAYIQLHHVSSYIQSSDWLKETCVMKISVRVCVCLLTCCEGHTSRSEGLWSSDIQSSCCTESSAPPAHASPAQTHSQTEKHCSHTAHLRPNQEMLQKTKTTAGVRETRLLLPACLQVCAVQGCVCVCVCVCAYGKHRISLSHAAPSDSYHGDQRLIDRNPEALLLKTE